MPPDRDTPTDAAEARDIRLKRVRYRAARRGFLEADLIFGPFAARHAGDLGPDELSELETLLDQPDQDLYAWVIEREPTPAAFDTPLMARLKAFRYAALAARREAFS